jgi:medium-chain acyl-[acyl-carrier-protein] hydrolase
MELKKLEKEYRVHVYETDPEGKLNLYSLFDYLQDIASEHAVKLGYGRDDLMKQNHFWVLSRIYAEISEWPLWEDKIVIKTWPKGTDKLFALRDYEVCFPDGRRIASGTSSWLIIDLTTRKIQRPDITLSTYNSELLLTNSLPRNAAKIEPAAVDGQITSKFKVLISDLDINLHTNNVRYLKWVSDSYDLGFVMKNVPYSAEINYLAESHYNEEIVIRVSEEEKNDKIFNHSILRTSDNTELCRIRIGWKENVVKK